MPNEVIRQRIVDLVQSLREKASAHFGRDIPMPGIFYDCTGTRGGYHRKGTLHFNPVLLEENTEEFIATTVPHEMAHHVQYIVYPETLTSSPAWMVRADWSDPFARESSRKRRSIHGEKWKSIMHLFGVVPDRCHDYDVTNAVRRRFERFPLYCGCDTVRYRVTLKIVNKMQRGKVYKCRYCHQNVSLTKPTPLLKNVTVALTPQKRLTEELF